MAGFPAQFAARALVDRGRWTTQVHPHRMRGASQCQVLQLWL